MSDKSYDISVNVRPAYIAEQSDPHSNHYVFSYTVTIKNNGTIPAKLLTRHWVITDGDGEIQEVKGEGVVGEKPYLKPGEDFIYTSGTMIKTPIGTMHGSYQMIADDGVNFDAEIPSFSLNVPNLLH
ncbi:MAG: Co2+/Mg2+ efflux protein ApaG [Thiotrichales bacterium]|nr:MAG: Co2+/Mg2+ efflux protein ApaG [Thiotrichales bacterium]